MSLCPPGSELVLWAASMAISISAELSADDTNVLASIFNSIGDNLAILAAKKQQCEEAQKNQTHQTDPIRQ